MKKKKKNKNRGDILILFEEAISRDFTLPIEVSKPSKTSLSYQGKKFS